MRFKIIFSLLIACLTLCACNADETNTKVSSNADSAEVSSKNTSITIPEDKYSDIIGFIEENDYYNAYNEFQKLTEEQRKNEYNPSDTQNALEEVEQKAYREENYDSLVKRIDITTNNLLNYFDLYSKFAVSTDENGNQFAYTDYFLRIKDAYTLAAVSKGYEMKISLKFTYTKKGRYYNLDTQTNKITEGMYTASKTYSQSRHNEECEINNQYFFDNSRAYYKILSNNNGACSDDYGKYMTVCEDFIFTYAKGYLYLETD